MITKTINLYADRDDVSLTTYILTDSPELLNGRKRPAVLVCPGGAYLMCSDREAEPVALRFAAMGYHAFVLRYSTYSRGVPGFIPTGDLPVDPNSVHPAPMRDIGQAFLTIHAHAEEWLVDVEKIAICGFSAGGHNCAMYSVYWHDPIITDYFGEPPARFRPAAVILSYAICDYHLMFGEIKDQHSRDVSNAASVAFMGTTTPSEELLDEVSPVLHVSQNTPPTFLWTTAGDEMVPAENSIRMANALARAGVPYEVHIFEGGPHGLSLADEATAGCLAELYADAAKWIDLAESWLRRRFTLSLPETRVWLASTAAPSRSHDAPLFPSEDEEQPYQRIFEAASDGLILNDVETSLVVEANPVACAMHGYTREEFIGLSPSVYSHSDTLAQFSEWVQMVQLGKEFAATAIHIRQDDSPFAVEVHGTGFTLQDRLCILSVVRDVSARIQSEQLLRQEVTARTLEQSTLLEISRTLASALELNPGLILDQLRMLVEYTHAAIFVLEDVDLFALAMRGPQWEEQAMPFRIQLENLEAQAAFFDERQPQRIIDVWGSEPAAQALWSLLGDQAAVLLEGIKAWMWVPLAVNGRVMGGIGVAHAEPDAFTIHQANLALTMANQAAITMVNAQLYEQAQTLATLQERQRLAQNLHDAVNQSLFSAGLIAEVLPRQWERDQDKGRQSLEDLRRLTRGALAEMRGLLAELQPQVLIDSDLGDLLRQLGNAYTGRTNIPVAIEVVGEGALQQQGALPADVQVAFYRLCQEAFNNIAKHAGASQVSVLLEYNAGNVALHIRDDGQGFDPERIPSGHYGLSMMRERAESVGMRLSVASRPGHGTDVTVHWTAKSERKS